MAIVMVGIGAGAVYACFALGLVVVYKTTRVLNFAQAEVGAFATFVTAAFVPRVGWPVGVLAGLIAAVGACLLFERLVVRRLVAEERLVLVVASIAAGLLLAAAELRWWGGAPRLLSQPFAGDGLSFAGVTIAPSRLVAIAVTVVVGAALVVFLRRTTFGLALLASAQDPVGVRLTGVRMRHLSAFTWGVSGLLGGVAGVLIALSLGAFGVFFLNRIMLFGFTAAVLGGMTSLPGAAAGGFLVAFAEAAILQNSQVPGLSEGLMFLVMLGMLLFRPQGLWGAAA